MTKNDFDSNCDKIVAAIFYAHAYGVDTLKDMFGIPRDELVKLVQDFEHYSMSVEINRVYLSYLPIKDRPVA
jgi:hypothetical protein